MLWLILGIIFCFLGGCNTIQSLGDRNEMAALGGAVIALFFFILGIPMFVAGIKSLSSAKETASSDDLKRSVLFVQSVFNGKRRFAVSAGEIYSKANHSVKLTVIPLCSILAREFCCYSNVAKERSFATFKGR